MNCVNRDGQKADMRFYKTREIKYRIKENEWIKQSDERR